MEIPEFSYQLCTTTGQKGCRSVDCCMNDKSKNKWDKTVKAIEQETIAFEMNTNAHNGKYLCKINRLFILLYL